MRLKGLHHVSLRVTNLPATQKFVEDFGLIEEAQCDDAFYYRGSGPGAYQLVLRAAQQSSLEAVAFEAEGLDDLEELVARHGAEDVGLLSTPGGGSAVELRDPEGAVIRVVAGIAMRQADPVPPPMILNQGAEKQRLGVFQAKAPLGPPQLLRLGHAGLFIKDWRTCDEWYRTVLGLIPSDILYAGHPDNVIGGFYRIDRGSEYVDHHALALFGFGRTDLHHISFEVQNPEVQFMGHRWMAQRQHNAIWGVGRHGLGSHVFDIWRDPSGYGFETFSDTDMLDASAPSATHPVTDIAMDLWSDEEVTSYFE